MEIKSDIQIAQEAHLENIKDVAAKVGVTEDELEMYGKYKAKLSDELIHRVENNEDGKLVRITAINPVSYTHLVLINSGRLLCVF